MVNDVFNPEILVKKRFISTMVFKRNKPIELHSSFSILQTFCVDDAKHDFS